MRTALAALVLLIAVQAPAYAQGMKFSAKASLGEKHRKVDLLLLDDKFSVVSKDTKREFPYDTVTSLTYSYAKHPRGKAAIGTAILCLPCGAALMFSKKKRHWLAVQADGIGAVALELSKKNWQQVASEIDAKSVNAKLERIEDTKKK